MHPSPTPASSFPVQAPVPDAVDPLGDEDVRTAVDDAIDAYLARLGATMSALDGATAPVLDEATALLAGGKRLRAAFCYWSWRAHGGTREVERTVALGTGLALELFQAAALVHDDVMDRSDTRRGRPAAHRAFAGLHERNGWLGSAPGFGESAAILLGDVLLTECNAAVRAATDPLPVDARRRTLALFEHMQTEVTLGQFLDVRAQAVPWGDDPRADEARARTVIRAKSARYSVEHPIALGAAIAGADAGRIASVTEYGLPLGEAFQLRDDVLGVFGDPALTGKPAGDDLREGKRTVLVCRAVRGADVSQRRLLLDRLGSPDLTEEEVGDLREVLVATGAAAAVEELIEERVSTALAALRSAGLEPAGERAIEALGLAAVRRLS
ncbi:polyprenyl synthetase family protein [Cellulomonas sp. PhB143]|uniref:polyprenyl synthetase family protein n=1 Tax=Cellulomonas sp. PhB143 TaxID=2485186 RepID=UPI000FA16248|nr:polyprenyl synthetase family protein [Cellulomonas sp. PhB143]ROS73004.1 geranylgeranyl diphosphate synthase type I [Cellulomonas sp. PhB143]